MKKLIIVYYFLYGTTLTSSATGFILLSRAFASGEAIAQKYTCDGENISPHLEWKNVPGNTKSLALIVDDPDAPQENPYVHWLIYNISPSTMTLSQGIDRLEKLSNGSFQGLNDLKKIGYDGPCPPQGKPHRYFFKLYALDITIPSESSMTKDRLLALMDGHIIAQVEIIGIYQRK